MKLCVMGLEIDTERIASMYTMCSNRCAKFGSHSPIIVDDSSVTSHRNRRFSLKSKRLSKPVIYVFCVLFASFFGVDALKSSMTYSPQGTNTLLYKPGLEPIMHLDQVTFVDTVFEHGRTQAFVVEFYADWCGHCRAFTPFYRDLAAKTYNWRPALQIAAMNCADNFNGQVCRVMGVTHFPMIKYIPRSATGFNDAIDLVPSHSVDNLLDQLAKKIVNEDLMYAYSEWPNMKFIEIDRNTSYEDLWVGSSPSVLFLLLIFERFDQGSAASPGFQLQFDLLHYRNSIMTRRVLSTSPLANMLSIREFPYVALFRRHSTTSLFMQPLNVNTAQSLLKVIQPNHGMTVPTTPSTYFPHTTTAPVFNCITEPEECKPLYFVSESDMLKATHMALLDEVARPNGLISGENFTHLYDFVSLLTDYFPVITVHAGKSNRRLRRNNYSSLDHNQNHNNGYRLRLRRSATHLKRSQLVSGQTGAFPSSSMSKILPRSERARSVFAHLKRVLKEKRDSTRGGNISAIDWRHQFMSVEKIYGYPFPVNASWQHCRGSTPEYRGYTCALWTTFHTLTVHTHLNSSREKHIGDQEKPIRPLKAIQGWVNSFFGCEHCRNHFMNMTTQIFPMNEEKIKRPLDAVLYLWRAHNIVNKRLHGKSTEDPQFLKYQFPPPFLCADCHKGDSFSRYHVYKFLVSYYVNIKPATDGNTDAILEQKLAQ